MGSNGRIQEFKSYSFLSDDIEEERLLCAELRKFNWGAFAFSWLWGACNGIFHKCFVVFVLFVIALFWTNRILVLILIGYAVYFGINGNRWVYNEKRITDVPKFIKGQRNWAAAFVIILCLSAGLLFIIVPLIVASVGPIFSPAGRAELMLKSTVRLIVSDKEHPPFKDGADIATYMLQEKQISKTMSRTKMEPYGTSGVKIVNDAYSSSEFFVLTFYKEETCAVEKKNCYVYYFERSSKDTLVPLAKAYYSDSGDIKIVQNKKKNKK